MSNKLHSVVTKTLLGTTLGIATGFLALAGTSSPSFAAAAKKPAAKTTTHTVTKPKTTSTKPKTATKAKTSSKHAAKKHATAKKSTKHAVKSTAKKSTKHAVKSAAKKSTKHAVKSTHATVKPKTTVSKTKTAPKNKK
jgi:hypothetical protein